MNRTAALRIKQFHTPHRGMSNFSDTAQVVITYVINLKIKELVKS